MNRKITIGHFYPRLLNLYGDSGNIACLTKRCEWRGVDVEIRSFHLDDDIDFQQLDIVFIGGGSEREQKMVCDKLRSMRTAFEAYIEDGGVVLAVCQGMDMLGNYYDTESERVEGLGILNICTSFQKERFIGNAVLESALTHMPIVGFENHNGRTAIGEYQPLGRVICGYGNDGVSQQEGVVYKHLIGTHLYGPLLPKNPNLCDWLIQKALERKYGDTELQALDDAMEEQANAYIVKRFAENN